MSIQPAPLRPSRASSLAFCNSGRYAAQNAISRYPYNIDRADHSITTYLRASRSCHKPNRVKIARMNVV